MEKNTTNCFISFIFLENFFSVNRSYIIVDKRKRLIWNFISTLIFTSINIANIYNIFFKNGSLYLQLYQGVLEIEFLMLTLATRHRNISFTIFKRLDEKCGVDDEIIRNLEQKVYHQTVIGVVSIITDSIGMYTVGANSLDVFTFSVMFSAHDAEMMFYALVIEGMNMRLMKLADAAPSAGSRVYRHVLIAANQMNEEFSPRILLLLAVFLVTTISYSCAVVLVFSKQRVAVYLLWRELKSMYCLWKLSMAASRSETMCQQLTFQLARSLAFDPALDKARNPRAYSVVHRWYSVMLHQRPRYVRGSVISIGLNVPLNLVDLSLNYVLIIIQIYAAYK